MCSVQGSGISFHPCKNTARLVVLPSPVVQIWKMWLARLQCSAVADAGIRTLTHLSGLQAASQGLWLH